MADVFFVKDGPGPDNAGEAALAISVADLEKCLTKKRIRYLGNDPPRFNPDNPSKYPERVVVEVVSPETLGAKFDKYGFYVIGDVTPAQMRRLIAPV